MFFRPQDYISEMELQADLIQDYTMALQLDDPDWTNGHTDNTQWQGQLLDFFMPLDRMIGSILFFSCLSVVFF